MGFELQRVRREWEAEVSLEEVRLIESGVPPWEAAQRAVRIVQARRRLASRVKPLAGPDATTGGEDG